MNALDIKLYQYAKELVRKRIALLPEILTTIQTYQNQYQHQHLKDNPPLRTATTASPPLQTVTTTDGKEEEEEENVKEVGKMCQNLKWEIREVETSLKDWFGIFQPPGHKGPSPIST